MEAPAGTTQTQADYIFYSQVAAGALVGFKLGQSISSTSSSLIKFTLSRLDRGIAGVDDTVILSIVNGLPATSGTPSLINVPIGNPVTSANVASIGGSGFTPPAIGSLTSEQIQALMAQIVNTVNQPADVITNETGVGQYGFDCQQLEMAGYVKPGTWQQFLRNGSGTLVDVLNAPGIFTGLNGVYSLDIFLASPSSQNDAQSTLMENGYASLQASGIITTPTSQSVSAVIGEVYTGGNEAVTNATATITNSVNSQIASLVTNSSQFGTQLTAQWANGLLPVTDLTSNLTKIAGQLGPIPGLSGLGTLTSGLTPDLASVKTAMDTLGKASQFAATASSTLTTSIGKLSAVSIDGLTSQLKGSAASLVTNLQGQLTGQATALLNQATGQFSSLLTQGDSLISNVQKAAGFANTVNRATVDVAFTKVLGSSKIPVPTFGVPDSASIGAALDITKAQSMLKNLQGQGTALLAQAQGQVQGIATNLPTVNRLLG